MVYLGKMLFVFALVSVGWAQNSWSGTVFGLPNEAAKVGLYLVDNEKLSTKVIYTTKDVFFDRVASGSLSKTGTFRVRAEPEKVQKALPARRILTLSGSPWGDAKVVPADARLSTAMIGVENARGDLIGEIIPRDKGRLRWPYLLLAHQPTLIEGSARTSELGRNTLYTYDAPLIQGFNLLQIVGGPKHKIITTTSTSPQWWLYKRTTAIRK